MAGILVVSCLVLVTFLDCTLVELERSVKRSNAAECNKLANQTECERVGACIWTSDPGTCSEDPCYERTSGAMDDCSRIPGSACEKIALDTITSFCVTSTRVGSFTSNSAKCSLEWGEFKIAEEGLCDSLTPCDTVSPVGITGGGNYYVCNEKPPVTDPCSKLDEDVCPYIGKCMWEGEQCVADPCWEKTYSSTDDCRASCVKNIISGATVNQLGYCKTPNHDLHDKCNGGTGSNFITKQLACSGYPEECEKIVTINNYEGGTLYVCSTAEGEFTIENSAVSLNSFAIAVFALILLVVLF